MQPKKHILAALGIVLIAALLAACGSPVAAPTATSVQPTATPVPPSPTPVPPTGESTPVAEAPETTVADEAILQPHQPRPDAPPYGLRGSYAVGVRDFAIDTPGRQITVTVWYPALNPEAAEESVTYFDPAAGFPTGGRALSDADPDLSGGPYPLVLYSPCAWGPPWISSFFTEHLVSHGFVVMATQPEDSWETVFESTYRSEISRPQELIALLDFAEVLTAPEGDMAGLIDMEHVAATGWSFGGQTALEMGGARLNLAEWQETFCVDFPDDGDCKDYPAHFEEMAALAGLEAVPDGLWPDWSNPRVDAVIAAAPGVVTLGGGGLEAMNRPIMLLVGTNDAVASMLEYRQVYETLPALNKTRVFFENADHYIFGNACPASPGLADAGLYVACSDQVWDMDRAHDLINHFATAFLLAELKGDAEAAAALAPENVDFPGIKYESTGYGVAPTAELDAATVAEIEALVKKTMAKNGIPGYALGVVKDGKIVYTKGFGVERVGSDQPVTVHSVFNTGSVGKIATATAIMQLVEAGKIDLDAPVIDYLPYFKLADERYRDITVSHLLSHRSGLPADPADWFPQPVEYDDAAIERYVRSLDNIELLFAPGDQWSYSSIGFAVLADIVAKVSDQTFEDYLQENIIDPLGMSDTMLIVRESDQSKVVGNHVVGADDQVVVSDIFPYRRQFAGTGPLYSSITDMARFTAANLNRGEFEGTRILPTTAYDAMWEPISETGVEFGPVLTPLFAADGMSWFIGELDGHRIINHIGSDEGFSAMILLAPDDHVGLVMSSNFFDDKEFNTSNWESAVKAMQIILAEGQSE